MTISDALAAVALGQIVDAKTIMLLQHLALKEMREPYPL